MSDSYLDDLTSLYSPEEEFAALDLAMPDDKLLAQLSESVTKSQEHWNGFPWRFADTDLRAVKYLYPDLGSERQTLGRTSSEQENHDDSVLFESYRAILSYATGQLGVPELTPSRTDAQAKRTARNMGLGLYQHSSDEHVEHKVRAMAGNVIARKRGWLKLRFDIEQDDVVTDVVPPEDLIIDRFAPFMGDPNAIHHRLRASLDELCAKFPGKAQRLYSLFGVKQGRYSQMSQMITYFETWFTYVDRQYRRHQGIASWLEQPRPFLLDKGPNPIWLYTGDPQTDRAQNLLKLPPKPFVGINYLGSGKSAIDETCLFEQAIPAQQTLNERSRQWHRNIDYVNGRWIYDTASMEEGMATRLVNKGQKTLAGVDAKGKPLNSIFANVGATPLGNEVYESLLDLRERVKAKMGTPNQFQGQDSGKQNTLGRDLLLKQQASALQDDFVKAIQVMYGQYYAIKLQLMLVVFNSDRPILVKGGDGRHEEVLLGPGTIDPNVKVGVKADSTLPLDQAAIRATSADLLKAGKIDYQSAMEDLGYDNPEVRTERYLRSQIDPMGYLQSVTQGIEQSDARDDIDAVIAGRGPKDRDSYDQDYLEAYNLFMTTNEFAKLDDTIKQALVAHLALVQHIASQQASLQEGMLDDAGMSEAPIQPPAPKKTIQIKGTLDAEDSKQAAGMAPPPTSPVQ